MRHVRTRMLEIVSIVATAVGTLLLTMTGALAQSATGNEVPGGLRNVGPAPGPVHEVPGGLRHMGPAVEEGAVPTVDAAVQTAAGVSLTWTLVLLASTAVVAAAIGYGLRAAQTRRATYVDAVSAG